MLVKIELPPTKVHGVHSRRLEFGDGDVIEMPANQPDLIISVKDKTPITLRLFDLDIKGNQSEPMELTFSTDAIPEFVPGQMRLFAESAPTVSEKPKLGGDLKSTLGVDDSSKKVIEAVKPVVPPVVEEDEEDEEEEE